MEEVDPRLVGLGVGQLLQGGELESGGVAEGNPPVEVVSALQDHVHYDGESNALADICNKLINKYMFDICCKLFACSCHVRWMKRS